MPAAPIIGAVAAVGGTAIAYKGYKDNKKATKQAQRAQEQQQRVSTRASRREAIRGAQLARAQAVATASAQGATGSSAALGGQGAIGSQLGSGLGYSTQMSGLSYEINQASAAAQRGSDLMGLGGTLFNVGLGMGGGDFLKGQIAPNRPPSNFTPTRSAWTP